MPEYDNTFVQGFHLEFENKSHYISLPEEIFRKAFKMSARAKNCCKNLETSGNPQRCNSMTAKRSIQLFYVGLFALGVLFSGKHSIPKLPQVNLCLRPTFTRL